MKSWLGRQLTFDDRYDDYGLPALPVQPVVTCKCVVKTETDKMERTVLTSTRIVSA